MPDNRFYVDSPLDQPLISLEGEEAHHMLHVMRVKAGDSIELVNGRGVLAEAVVERVAKKELTVQIEKTERKPPPHFKTIIAQAMPRFNRLDTLLEKGTELGMDELWLFEGARSEKAELSANQKERAQKIFVSALKQCGRLYLPQIRLMPPLSQWDKPDYPLFFGTLEENVPTLLQAWKQKPPSQGIIFVIGPERGLAPEELNQLKNLNGKGVTLSPHILRAETAPLAALSIIGQLITQN